MSGGPGERRGHPVATLGELPPGGRKVVEVAGKSVGIFNVGGSIRAYLNVCPHELAPVCLGRVSGTTLPGPPGEYRWGREGEILFCPWHGWEFDLLTGECLTDKRRLRQLTTELHHLEGFEVALAGDTIVVYL